MTLTIRDDARREIQKDVDALSQYSKYYVMKVERAKTYFPLIEKIFAEEQLPDDFKYLVLQESALVPDAVSVSNAVGFWQFKDFTALQMGMRVDKEVDERMNIISATRGAARYLKQNNVQFDNWLYALQSYQMGAGGVKRAVGDKDMGSRHMEITSATYWYVKKYLAHKVAFENAVKGDPQLTVSVFESHNKRTLSDLATEISLDEALLKEYNKWAKGGTIPDDKIYHVIIPGGKADQDFNKLTLSTARVQSPVIVKPAEERTPAPTEVRKEINNVSAIQAVAGETPAALAKRAGIDLKYLLRYNDMSIDKGITAGSFYFTEKKRKRGNTAYHKMVAGEDLWAVSQRYGVQLRKLKKMNRLQGDVVTAGTMLWLNSQKPETTVMEPVEDEAVAKLDDDTFNWEAKEAKPTVVAKMVLPEAVSEPVKKDTVVITPDVVNDSLTLHTVRKGESLYSISKLYGTEVSSILEENSLSVTDGLKTGQLIKIRTKANTIVDSSGNTPVEKDSVVARADEASYIIYEVKASDTLYGVARQHGVTIKEIMDWNGKDTFSLSLGEKLKIWKR